MVTVMAGLQAASEYGHMDVPARFQLMYVLNVMV